MTSTNNILELKDLSKYYSGTQALTDVDLDIPRGQIIGLLGPNGSGKTTLIKIISGLLMKYKGEVKVNGEAVGPSTKAIVSYLPDKSIFGEWMRAKDAFDVFEDFFEDFNRSKAQDMMKSLNLDENQRLKTMSKGMLEKFQLVLVMSRKAQLYLLDEPIAGVDPATRDYILDTILKNYNEDGTIILSTHLIQDVEKIFDSVIFLKEGRIELYGNVDDIRAEKGKSIDELFREVFKC